MILNAIMIVIIVIIVIIITMIMIITSRKIQTKSRSIVFVEPILTTFSPCSA